MRNHVASIRLGAHTSTSIGKFAAIPVDREGNRRRGRVAVLDDTQRNEFGNDLCWLKWESLANLSCIHRPEISPSEVFTTGKAVLDTGPNTYAYERVAEPLTEGPSRHSAVRGWATGCLERARVNLVSRSVEAPRFDLGELFRRVDSARRESGQSWASLSTQVGVAVSTIRRFEHAADAEADGVLAVVGWLGVAPGGVHHWSVCRRGAAADCK
jgi:hypothetical protein